jgi:uncharacterized protein YecT (DUF1311 family)
MRKSPVRAVAISTLMSLIATSDFPVIAAPSFDCKAAKEEAEKIICRSEKLAVLDQQIADAYKAALGRLAGDPAAVAALRDGQRSFIALRDKGLNTNPDDVAELMETHRNFLRSIAPGARVAFLGVWEAVGGVVIIRRGKRGKFDVDAETFGDPLWGTRYCRGGGGNFSMKGRTLVSSNGPREWNQKLSLRGHLLVLQEIAPKVRKSGEAMREPDYCGANGSLEGTFFPVRGPKPSYGDSILAEP